MTDPNLRFGHLDWTSGMMFTAGAPGGPTIVLDGNDYRETLTYIANLGIAGAQIYDALILRAAVKHRAEVIYTWNVKRFHLLASTGIKRKIKTP